MFEGFKVNSRWPPNRVTDQEEINKLEKAPHGAYMCKVSSQSVQPFWRRRFLKFINFNPRWLPNHVTYEVIIFFSTVNCCADEAQEISDFSYAALYLTNFDRPTS